MRIAKIHKSAIHSGEEPFVLGNDRAGMIYFSGCHLKCSFCYVPEISRNNLWGTPEALISALDQLQHTGAKNLSLLTVTHFWRGLISVIRKYSSPLPWVIKLSGYEPFDFLKQLTYLPNAVLNFDFKFFSEASRRFNLPAQYGVVASQAIEYLNSRIPVSFSKDSKLTSGPFVRHLWVPQMESETHLILHFLKSIQFRGPFNLMTRFIDPEENKLLVAPSSFVSQCRELASGIPFYVDGRLYE